MRATDPNVHRCAPNIRGEAEIIVAILREMLTVRDVALELRCSVTHVYNVINGKVKNVARLPTIAIGRRKKLIQRDTLEEWKRSNEHGNEDVLIASSKVNARRHMDKDFCA
jgi:helix-turn-helix protein